MTNNTTSDPSLELDPSTQSVKDFYLARQPILDRDQHLFAYELLFRSAACGPADVTDDLIATASVMSHVAELGLENVVGNAFGFLNVDAAVLMSDFVSFLPSDKVVLEILETVKVTPEIIERVIELEQAGYIFALDDVIAVTDDIQKLVPLVEIIKIDIMGVRPDRLEALCGQFKQANKKLLAEKVETLEEFQQCLKFGFDYFQGYYFARPVTLTGKKLSPSQMAIVQLMNLIITDAETAKIESTIKQDASLGLNLLRMVNTPGLGVTQRIDSMAQALLVLGRRQLQRWLQILLYADSGQGGGLMSPLLLMATTRGKLLELVAQKLKPGNHAVADTCFTVGIMSLMDTLFGLPMAKILEQIAVADDVQDALLNRSGLLGDILRLAEYSERIEASGPLLALSLQTLQLSTEDFNEMQLAAFEWSNHVSSTAA